MNKLLIARWSRLPKRSLDSNYGKEVVRDGMNAMGGIH